jgi:YfiH family protein
VKNNYIDFSHHFGSDGPNAYFSLCDQDCSSINIRKRFVANLGFDPSHLVVPNQVHSNKIKLVDRPCFIENVDGIISKSRNIVLSILVADCIPLFLFNPTSKHFALVHSGWRGTDKNICLNVINKLKDQGDNSKDLLAIIGPSIGQCCFEVGSEVASKFDACYSFNGKKDKMMLNLSNILKDQLIQSGVKRNNIFINKQCTYCETELFHSYRREGSSAGRMVAICGWH